MAKLIYHGIGSYASRDSIGPTCLKWHDVLVVTQGSISLDVGGKPFEMDRDDAIVIPPGNRFYGTSRGGVADIWVAHVVDYQSPFSDTWFLCQRAHVIRRAIRDEFLRLSMEKIHKVYGEQDSFWREMALGHLLGFFLASLERLSREPDEGRLFDKVMVWAEENLEKGVQTRDLAKREGLSESHFRAKYRDLYGEPPSRALRRLRIEKAKGLLRQTRKPIKEISRLAGYGDLIAFHRAFKNETGLTPADYRARHPRPL